MNIQAHLSPQEFAELVDILDRQGVEFPPQYSSVVRALLRGLLRSLGRGRFAGKTAHEALEFLAARGFSIRQLHYKKGAALRRELSLDEEISLGEEETSENSKRAAEIASLFNQEFDDGDES